MSSYSANHVPLAARNFFVVSSLSILYWGVFHINVISFSSQEHNSVAAGTV